MVAFAPAVGRVAAILVPFLMRRINVQVQDLILVAVANAVWRLLHTARAPSASSRTSVFGVAGQSSCLLGVVAPRA